MTSPASVSHTRTESEVEDRSVSIDQCVNWRGAPYRLWITYKLSAGFARRVCGTQR
jgi:hypothetical protein